MEDRNTNSNAAPKTVSEAIGALEAFLGDVKNEGKGLTDPYLRQGAARCLELLRNIEAGTNRRQREIVRLKVSLKQIKQHMEAV